MSPKQENHDVRGTVTRKQSTTLCSNPANGIADRASTEAGQIRSIGPPVVGQPWLENLEIVKIEVVVERVSEPEAGTTRRSFGIQFLASKRRALIILLLLPTLVYVAATHDSGLLRQVIHAVMRLVK